MTTTLYALFDGKNLLPEKPIQLAPNTRVRLIIETAEPEEPVTVSFLQTAQSLNLEGPADWSERLEDYLYSETLLAGVTGR